MDELSKIDSLLEISEKEKRPSCKGLLFRGYSSTYYNDGEICIKEGFKLLKENLAKVEKIAKVMMGKTLKLTIVIIGF